MKKKNKKKSKLSKKRPLPSKKKQPKKFKNFEEALSRLIDIQEGRF